MKRAAEEDAVDRPVDRPPVLGDGGQHEQAHPVEPAGESGGIQPPLVGDDGAQVRPGRRVTAVEQVLETSEIVGGLVHTAERYPVRTCGRTSSSLRSESAAC